MQLSRGFTCAEMVELMTDYLEGRLSRRDTRRFDRHLSLCDGCSAYIEQLRTTIEVTGRLRDRDFPPELLERLLAAFRDWHPA